MERTSRADKRIAERLLALSRDAEGELDASKVENVLAWLRTRPLAERHRLLSLYVRLVRRDRRASTLLVEYAGEEPTTSLQTLLAAKTSESGRPLRLESRPNPALIGGLRVRLGDDVWDASLAARLDALLDAAG